MCLRVNIVRFCSLIAVVAIAAAWLAACSRPSLEVPLSHKADVQQLKQGDFEVINRDNPGAELSLTRFARYGKYTVFDFSSPY